MARNVIFFPQLRLSAPMVPDCSSARRIILLLLLALACWPLCAYADSPASENVIRGQVLDPSGALIAKARLTLHMDDTTTRTATSDNHGDFLFTALPPGPWSLTVRAAGFRDLQQTILLKPGQQLTLSIRLEVEIDRQRVAVSDQNLDSSPDRTLGAVILRGSDLRSLPTNPRDLQRLLSLMAGSDLGAQFYIDGFTADHLPPKDSIQEIRLNQDPFSAQYDTPGNDRIEIITKPGGDQLHGNLVLLGDYSPLNSRNPYVATQPAYSSFFAQGDVNGPLTKASSWFLTFEQENMGAQSFIHAITSSTAPAFTETLSSPENGTELTPRIDFQWSKKQILSFRYDFDHENQDNLLQSQLSLPDQAINTRHGEHTFQFSDSQTYGPNLINETRFQYIHLNNASLALNGDTSILVQGAFNGGGNNLGQARDIQNRYEFQDHVSLLRGNHLLQFGGRIRDTLETNSSTGGFNGEFIFPSIDAYEITQQGIANGLAPAEIRAQGGGASQFSLTAGTPQIRVNVADLGLYFEDQWKLTPSMTLTPGLRFETQSGIPDHDDLAPRLTYGWSIGKPSKPAVVLRAGVGLFYQRFTPDLVLNADRQNGVLEQQYIVQDPDFYPNSPAPEELGNAALPTIYRISPDLQAPSTLQTTVGLEKQFSRFFVHADYTYFRGIHLLLTRNINAPLPGTFNPDDPNSGVRPLGTLQNIYEYQSAGLSRRNELYVNFRYNTKSAILYGYYVLGKRLADTAGPASFPSNQYDLKADYGRATNDVRNRAYFGGIIHAPFRLDFNPFFIVESSAPFNITTGQDLNGDSQFNDRPAFATDLSRPSVVRTRWGTFDTDPMPGQQIIPINYANGPSFLMLNMTATRNIPFGPKLGNPASGQDVSRRYLLSLGIEAQNLFNNVNGGVPVGVLSSPLFGHSTSISANQFITTQSNRILYLHLSFSF